MESIREVCPIEQRKIGCHLSASKGYMDMGRQALSINATTFQFFTRNPRGGKAKELDEQDVADFNALAKEKGIGPILAHAPYTLNPCAAKENLRVFARETMADDLRRLSYTPGNMYNFHPGSHVGQGMEEGVRLIAELLNEIMTPDMPTTILLETMAGKGSEVGGRFQELRAIIDQVELGDQLGVCMDSCHVFDAGYDIQNHLDDVLDEFEQTLGLHRLKAIHLNDSLHGYGSHKDRHAKLGEGHLGLEAIRTFLLHPKLRHLPIFLETPCDLEGYGQEIALIREIMEKG